MNISNINLLISIGSLSVGLLSWFFYNRKTKGARAEKERTADKEVKAALTRLLAQGDTELEISIVDALVNSKYRECGLDVVPIDKLPNILEDLVAEFAENILIPYEVSQDLIKKTMLLRKKLEGRKLNLEKAAKNWQRLSIPAIVLRVIYIAAIALVFGLLVVIFALVFVNGAAENLSVYLIALLILTLTLIFTEAKTLWEKRGKSARHLHGVLEDSVIKALRDSMPNADIERNARIETDGQIAQVDLVIQSNGEKLPVEVKHGAVSYRTIEQIAEVMRKMGSNKGLLITASKLREQIREFARQKSVIIIDGVTSETDIVDGLKNTKLFG